MSKAAKAIKRGRHRPPNYWWDFHHHDDGRMTLRVETNDPKVDDGVVREFSLPEGDAQRTIDAADALIADLRAGRRSVRP